MATYTSNYGWTKPSGSDNVDISVLNNNLDDQDSTIHDAFLNMAASFSESSTYAVDDIVLYGTKLYKCHTAVVTPGSWTGSTNWQVYKLSEGGGGGGGTSDYPDLTNKPQINGVTLTGNKTTSGLGINADNVMLSDGVTSVEDAVDGLTSRLGSLISRGIFNVHCAAGRNIFSRSTVSLVGGSLPPNFQKSMCLIINHGTVQDSPNTIEADGPDTFIIQAASAQNITVGWLDLSNVPTAT